MKKVPVSCAVIVNADGAEVLLLFYNKIISTTSIPQTQFKSVLSILMPLKEAYEGVTKDSKCSDLTQQVGAADKPNSDVNKLVVSSLLTALEESLQVSQVPEFLKVIESIEAADNESDGD